MAGEKGRPRRANGQGSIYQRTGDGKWISSAYVYTSSGEIKRRPVYGSSFDEVRAELDKLKVDSAIGVPVPDQAFTVEQWFTRWLAGVREELRPTTYVGYEMVVRLYLVPGLGRKRLRRLSAADVRAFMAGVRECCLCCMHGYDHKRPEGDRCCSVGRCCGRHPSPRQVQYVHAVLRNGLGAAEREELVARNVAKLVKIRTPRYGVGKGSPSTRPARCSARPRAGGTTRSASSPRRSGCAWVSCWACAGRTSTSSAPRSPSSRRSSAPTAGSTSPRPEPRRPRRRSRCRRSPGASCSTTAPARRRSARSPATPGATVTSCSPRRSARPPSPATSAARELAGLPGVRLHDLRHTVVSLLLELGTPPHVVQAIARHAHIDVTMSIYAHTNLHAMRQALDAIEWKEL